MIIKNNKVSSVLILAIGVGGLYFISTLLRPVEIVAVHQVGNFSDVLVNNFPLTNKGKIDWWLANKSMLKDRYDIPKPASYGAFTIVFWDFGDGYMEEGKYDRRCFEDMPPPVNCIEKNKEFTVKTGRDDEILFGLHDGLYHLKKDGEIFKQRD